MTSLRAETVPVPVPIVLLSLVVGPLSYQIIIKRLIFGIYLLILLIYNLSVWSDFLQKFIKSMT